MGAIRFARTVLAGLTTLVIAGCTLMSDLPLIRQGSTELVFGERFTFTVEQNGSILDYNGQSQLVSMEADRSEGDVYVMRAPDGSGSMTVAFQAIDALPDHYLVGLGSPDGYQYAVLKVEGNRARPAEMSFSQSDVDALNDIGVQVTLSTNGSARVQTTADLEGTTRYWVGKNRDSLSTAFKDGHYLIARTAEEVTALRVLASAQRCAMLAASPDDPVLRRLPERFRKGVVAKDIRKEEAQEACEAALGATPEWRPSVHLALFRVLWAKQEPQKALPYLHGLVSEGFVPAVVEAVRHGAFGGFGEPDPAGARRMLERFAPASPVIAAMYGLYILEGYLDINDLDKARILLEGAAREGEPLAFYGLGKIYRDGRGQPKNPERALRLFLQGAGYGHVNATFAAGLMHYYGDGVKQNFAAAFPLLEKAAREGEESAAYMVGFMQVRGQGTSKAEVSGYNWIKKAYEMGMTSAEAELGYLTYYGIGTTANREAGLKMLRDSAGEGVVVAKQYLEKIDQGR